MRIISFFFFAFLANFSFAQENTLISVQIDDRLFETFEKTYLENVKNDHPSMILRLNYYLDNAYYISDIPEGKEALEYPNVYIEDIDKFNILTLEKEQQIHPKHTTIHAYRINDSNKLLVYYSGQKFTEALNNSLGRTH